jgi:deoxyribonuclease V
MFVCVDVQYDDALGTAKAAAAAFSFWSSPRPNKEWVVDVKVTEPYVPGQFYLRELPCLLAALSGSYPSTVIVDEYVWLGVDQPGLGAHLSRSLGTPVVGVAKRVFPGAPAIQVLRGASLSPLFVTAIGLDADSAADGVRSMHGEHRIPTVLKRVDQLARGIHPPVP